MPNYSTQEEIGGGATTTRSRRQHHHKRAERLLGILQHQSPSAATPIELSEEDIFNTPSGCSSPSPTRRSTTHNPSASRKVHRNQYGILAALDGDIKNRSGSGYDIQPVFNRKAFAAGSLSSSFSSSSASPATPVSYRMTIPRPPPRQADRVRVYHQSAPVNIPVMPKALRRRAMELEDNLSEEEDTGVRLPPHEVVDSRHSPALACSVLEGDGRTLKGRDLRKVRNAVWRKIGFID